MKKVIIESPFAGDQEANESYLNKCLRDSLDRGEAPFASHGLYTRPGVLDDTKHRERSKGIKAGFAWRECADLTAFYIDRGFSEGMTEGLIDAIEKGQAFEIRTLRAERERGRIARIMAWAILSASVKKYDF